MRDLLQELGGEIVRQESINPGNRKQFVVDYYFELF